MQKKLIALAVAAAFSAPAFADTTVYGIVDAAVANISATGVKSSMTVLSGGLSTSRFGVKTVEDLDNGMKAVAVLEYALDVANNETVGTAHDATGTLGLKARQQIVALAGGFGTVAAGYAQTTGYDWAVKFDPTAGSAVDSVAATNPATLLSTSSRAPHAIAYISPDMGGVTVAYNHSFDVANTGLVASGATTGNKTTANLLSVNYAGGPLAVGGAYAGTSNDDTGYAKVTQMALGASYDFGVAKLFGTYTTAKADKTGVAGNTDKGMSLSVVAPVGPGAIVGTVAKKTVNTTAATDDVSAMTVAYLQSLSKTTTAYVALQKVSVNTAVSSDTTVVAVGLKKAF
jgi:predicted porin